MSGLWRTRACCAGQQVATDVPAVTDTWQGWGEGTEAYRNKDCRDVKRMGCADLRKVVLRYPNPSRQVARGRELTDGALSTTLRPPVPRWLELP